MPSVQKSADQLREQAYKTLMSQIQSLEGELKSFNDLFANGIQNIRYKLDTLRNNVLIAAEPTLNDYIQEAIGKRDIVGKMLALFTRGLRIKEAQEEILDSLLDNAVNCFPRVALFAIRGDVFKGWSCRGFSSSTAMAISSDEFRLSGSSWLLEALRNGDQAKSANLPDMGSLRLMRDESQGSWRFYPLYVLGRPVAVLLAGEAEGYVGRPDALAALMDCAALRLENVALTIIKSLGESAPVNANADVLSAEPAPEKTIEGIAEPLATQAPRPQIIENAGRVPAFPAKPEGFAIPPIVETKPAAANTAPSTPPPPAMNPGDAKLHAAAKRFAELLVSGIKLYNEGVIAEGRKNRDLYKRLRKNMDRNREMYEKRVAPAVAQKIDYLHEEFVRILGNGDAGVFGNDYPGPILFKKQTGS